MSRRSYFKCPNALATDDRLSYDARRIGIVLYAYSNALGACCKSYAEIAALAGCAPATVQEAVERLADAGYITYATHKRYVEGIKMVGYGKNIYSVNLNKLSEGYTRIDRSTIGCGLKGAAFILCVCVLISAGNSKRAWPSITKLQKMSGAARSTVCAALRLLKRLPSLLVQLCVRQNKTFAANSYFIVSKANAVVPRHLTINEARTTSACPSARFYFSIYKRIQQGLNHIFSAFRVVRNIVTKAIT